MVMACKIQCVFQIVNLIAYYIIIAFNYSPLTTQRPKISNRGLFRRILISIAIALVRNFFFLLKKCISSCITTLIMHEKGTYLLISIVFIAIYACFDLFTTISHLKWPVKSQKRFVESEYLISTI